ncbi:hypothetical protein Purlil1_11710 [Purpureocillium lilacinum]|uniref:Uncharacterized protein n=1 Tax=Purpureocillium lilacinum TaxID=33203 RepID=A0ABR0BIW5_PURLI|nr:hypothetical protein Purlil1_11710 [Purpureocillium lilacinum]
MDPMDLDHVPAPPPITMGCGLCNPETQICRVTIDFVQKVSVGRKYSWRIFKTTLDKRCERHTRYEGLDVDKFRQSDLDQMPFLSLEAVTEVMWAFATLVLNNIKTRAI